MGNILNTLKGILALEENTEFFSKMDKLITNQKAIGITEQEEDILFTFMKKLINQKPTNYTLLLVNRITNEISDESRSKFLSLYPIFLAKSSSEGLKEEVRWLLNYQKSRLNN